MAFTKELTTLNNLDEPVYKITDLSYLKYLRDKILFYWKNDFKILNNQVFPGAQPVSIERKDLRKLKNDYVVCAKMDGERYFLYMTTIPDKLTLKKSIKKKITLLVDRNFDFFIVDDIFEHKSIYTEDTLFDGELLKRNDFIVHDTIIAAGKNVKNMNWEIRWKTCDDFLKKYRPDPTKNLKIFLKTFFHVKHILHLIDHINKHNIDQDGFIFYPMREGVKFKRQWSLFKLKPPGLHTVDFKIKFVKDKCELYSWEKGNDYKFTQMDKNKILELGPLINGQIVEFKIDDYRFIPYKIRNDKNRSNNLYTVEKTLLNSREKITVNEIVNLFTN